MGCVRSFDRGVGGGVPLGRRVPFAQAPWFSFGLRPSFEEATSMVPGGSRTICST